MTYAEITNGYLIRLDKDELLIRSLSEFVEAHQIFSGWIHGIGGARWAELAFYHLEQKAYEFDRIDEALEITNISGNVSLLNDKPFLHIHATVADLNFHAYAGHLKELAVGATAEIYIESFGQKVQRVHNDACGLKVFDFADVDQ